jgi:ribosomal protein S18 acetylase RimI-like enzyme
VTVVRDLTDADLAWFRATWRKCEAQLGELGTTGGPLFHWYLTGKLPGHRFSGVEPYAFVHWRLRRDGWRRIYDMGVDPEARGRGLGRALLEFVGLPCRLSTSADNDISNGFYRAMGFRKMAVELARRGTGLKNVYERLR